MGFFDKKFCDVCGEKIGLLGNKKLEDANLCKNCARKLSPWFSGRRHSTLDEIKAQLAYREENQDAVAKFKASRSFGDDRLRLFIDEAAGKFTVCSSKALTEENPDIVDISSILDVSVEREEHKTELEHEDSEGNMVSYDPPRYEYSYDFNCSIRVNHPYFDEMSFQLNDGEIENRNGFGSNPELDRYQELGQEIEEILQGQANAPVEESYTWTCPSCAAINQGKFCEACGSPRPSK